jgi:hypothetical protein
VARRQSTDSSLELLLDTITNTFGSVLFLTILVTLLLRTASDNAADSEPGAPPMSATDQGLLEARIADASRDYDRLQTRLAGLTPVDPGLVALKTTVLERANEAVRTLAEVAAVDGRTLEEQRLAVAVDAELDRIDAALAEIKPQAEKEAERRRVLEEEAAALAKLAVDLDRPVDSAKIVQTAVLPVLGATDKNQIGLYLRYGRLYVMHRWTDAGEQVGPNLDHFLVTSKPDGTQVATARPDAGYIADAATVHRELSRILRSFPADRWVVGVVVYDDSFAQFQAVKAGLVELGYEYEPIRTGPGNPVRDRGGSSRGQ